MGTILEDEENKDMVQPKRHISDQDKVNNLQIAIEQEKHKLQMASDDHHSKNTSVLRAAEKAVENLTKDQ